MEKILIVDDDEKFRYVLARLLEFRGYKVTQATNGVEAFAKIMDEKPRLIVLDVLMPIMDGYKFAQEMKWREDFKNIPILVLSGRDNTKEIFDDLGVSHFLTKPFESDKLLDLVAEGVK